MAHNAKKSVLYVNQHPADTLEKYGEEASSWIFTQKFGV